VLYEWFSRPVVEPKTKMSGSFVKRHDPRHTLCGAVAKVVERENVVTY